MALFGPHSSSSMLVVRKFEVNDDPTAQTPILIEGRAPGLISWILTLLKLHPDVFLELNQTELKFHSASLSGVAESFIPLSRIASTSCGYRRRIASLILAAAAAAWGLLSFLFFMAGAAFTQSGDAAGMGFVMLIGWLLVGGIFWLFYYFGKLIEITVETSGGAHYGLGFKPSAIEGKSIDMENASRAIAVLNAHVLAASPVRSGTPATPAPSPQVRQGAAHCPQCSAINPAGARFCGNCGFVLS